MAKVEKIDLLQKPTKSKSILEDSMVCVRESSQRAHSLSQRWWNGSVGYLQCIIMFNLGLMGTPCEQAISRRGQSHLAWHFDSLCFCTAFLFFTASRKRKDKSILNTHRESWTTHAITQDICGWALKEPRYWIMCLPSPGKYIYSSTVLKYTF